MRRHCARCALASSYHKKKTPQRLIGVEGFSYAPIWQCERTHYIREYVVVCSGRVSVVRVLYAG